MTIRCSLLLSAMILPALSSEADDQVVSPVAAAKSAERVLVLMDGKVVMGNITPRDDGYDIELLAGRRFVPSQLVRFQASSLDNAYCRMRQSIPELTPNHHVELANWCAANGLHDHARRELLDALHLDPHRGEAKRMLQALLNRQSGTQDFVSNSDAGYSAAGSTAVQSAAPQTFNPAAAQGSTSAERRSLGGFSKPIAKAFVQNIQPLLANKCATGGCHGSRDRNFAMVSIRPVSTPSIAERNLASVLKQIDLNAPESSPLLQAAMGNHASHTEPILMGRTGQTQIEIIRGWVFAVAGELSPVEKQPLLTQLSRDTLTAAPRRQTADAAYEQSVHGQTVTYAESDRRALREIEYMNRVDAFDPAVFNQKYHSETQKQTTASDNDAR